jgi:hypothetical protein
MFMNRWLFRHEIVELNELNTEEQKEVFAVLKPILGEGGKERFLESEADRIIEEVRRPRDSNLLSGWIEEDVEVIEQKVGDRNSWAASVDPDRGKPLRKLPPVLLVDEKQAAQMLGVSRRMIFDLNHQGTLPCVMVGSRKKYSVKMLQRFADGGKV